MKLTKQQLKNIKEQLAHPDENRIANTINDINEGIFEDVSIEGIIEAARYFALQYHLEVCNKNLRETINTIKVVRQLLNKLEDQKSNTCKKRRPIKTKDNESDSDSFCGTGYAREDDDVPNDREAREMNERLRRINEEADQELFGRFDFDLTNHKC